MVNMFFIAHRGNMFGPNPEKENEPNYIMDAIKNGFDVEVDIWFRYNCSVSNGIFYLGHDRPQYPIDNSFIEEIKTNTWFHCKNLNALNRISEFENINYFWHQNDDFTLTSNGYIWTYPGKLVSERCILVQLNVPNLKDYDILPAGICSDYMYWNE